MTIAGGRPTSAVIISNRENRMLHPSGQPTWNIRMSRGFSLIELLGDLRIGVWWLFLAAMLPVVAATGWEGVAAGTEVRLTAQQGNLGGVNAIAMTPDERLVLTGCNAGIVCLWDTATGRELRRYPFSQSTMGVALRRQTRQFLQAGVGIRLCDISTGAVQWQAYDTDWFDKMAVSSNDQYVLALRRSGKAILLDAQTGNDVRVIGRYDKVTAIAIAPDSRFILTGETYRTEDVQREALCLWRLETGELVREFTGTFGRINTACFTPDSQRVITGGTDMALREWDIDTGMEIARCAVPFYPMTVTCSSDAMRVFVGGQHYAALWNRATHQVDARHFQGYIHDALFTPLTQRLLVGGLNANDVETKFENASLWDTALMTKQVSYARDLLSTFYAAVSPDGRYVVLPHGSHALEVWDLQQGRVIRQLTDKQSLRCTALAFSADGATLFTAGQDYILRSWHFASGEILARMRFENRLVYRIVPTPDNRYLLVGGTGLADTEKGSILVIDLATRQIVQQLQGHTGAIHALAVSPDSRYALSGCYDGTVRLWDIPAGILVRTQDGFHAAISCAAVSADGQYGLVGSWDGQIMLWNLASGQRERTFGNRVEQIYSVAFSPDGQQVLAGGESGIIRIWDIHTGTVVRELRGHEGAVGKVVYLQQGRLLLTSAGDCTLRVWDMPDGRLRATLRNMGNGDWVVIAPSGQYDAANGGDVEGLHWVTQLDFIALAQLKDRYYEPGLLAKIMGYHKEPLRNVEAFTSIAQSPKVTVYAPQAGDTTATTTVTNRGGGIGKVRVLVNGKEVTGDARGSAPDPQAKTATLTVNLAGAPSLIPGQDNIIEVVAYNAEGYLSSRGEKVTWTAPGMANIAPPELYAIVVGVADYAGEAIDLRFPAKDATDFSTALRLGAKRLFGTEKVHLTLLTTGSDHLPTRANLHAAFTAAKAARPQDVLVVYLAGHGVTLPQGQDTYCYLTMEARSTQLTDPGVRAQVAVTSEELQQWLTQVPALKQVMILDTCAAGAAATKLVEKRDIPGDQIRAIERLKDRTGFHVLMGCAGDAVSYEASQYGQGVLTYALLQGMKGAALRDDSFVDIQRLFQYTADQVPQLARNIGGIQRPVIAAPRGTSFDVGQLTPEDRARVPLAAVKPLVLRPMLLNPEEVGDTLQLTPKLVTRLREETAALVRGGGALVYVDADDLPGALVPKGAYTVQGHTITVKLALWRDGRKTAELRVDGQTTDVPALITRLCTAIVEQAGKVK